MFGFPVHRHDGICGVHILQAIGTQLKTSDSPSSTSFSFFPSRRVDEDVIDLSHGALGQLRLEKTGDKPVNVHLTPEVEIPGLHGQVLPLAKIVESVERDNPKLLPGGQATLDFVNAAGLQAARNPFADELVTAALDTLKRCEHGKIVVEVPVDELQKAA